MALDTHAYRGVRALSYHVAFFAVTAALARSSAGLVAGVGRRRVADLESAVPAGDGAGWVRAMRRRAGIPARE